MSELNKKPEIEQAATGMKMPEQGSVASASRRRLIKLGTAAVPVVATLASRPAMAWHCKSPSAWGSNPTLEDANLTASQKANPAHDVVLDEVWTVKNWCDNSTRYNLANPWDVVKGKCGLTKNFTAITFADISKLGITWPSAVDTSKKVVNVLNANGGAQNPPTYINAMIVALLNYKLIGKSNGLAQCMMPLDIQEMASGKIEISKNVTWYEKEIRDYLYNNYVSRGS